MASPFDVLEVDSDADDEEIERAYRRRVKEAHPDHGGSAREFQLVYTAYRQVMAGNTDAELEVASEADADERDTASAAESEADPSAPEEEPEPEETGSKVEFLNYEILADHGWQIDDDDLFEKASEANLDQGDYGRFFVQPRENLLEAAENRGFSWPYSCRGGACANCAIAVVDGAVEMPSNHILPSSMTDSGIQLSCISRPVTDEMKVVYNVKSLPGLDELRLPSDPFDNAQLND
ncbi:ferredoxin [Haloprofundus marisrubri]|uniref:Ferredoxin n=1 Tax=Haloprofundus marisrubri TaxID=1514971 RepID=A0A0W1REM5_9EURY|nr:ferredoxin Fer [Haloprofundus marisrubri]KTG11606.1 ferredoxin [Haloprofundus marisrubri]